jgi:hypothetical protein
MSEMAPLSPVAIKKEQTEISAPQHTTWDTLTCPHCSETFFIGPNHIYASRVAKEELSTNLLAALADDHSHHSPHKNSYEFKN